MSEQPLSADEQHKGETPKQEKLEQEKLEQEKLKEEKLKEEKLKEGAAKEETVKKAETPAPTPLSGEGYQYYVDKPVSADPEPDSTDKPSGAAAEAEAEAKPTEAAAEAEAAAKPASVISDWKDKSIAASVVEPAVLTTHAVAPLPEAAVAAPGEIERVPIETVLASGWQHTTKNIFLLFAISTLYGLVCCAPHAVRLVIADIVNRNLFLNICLGIVGAAIPLIYHMGRLKVTIRFFRNEPFTSDDFVTVVDRVFHYLLMLICRAIAIFAGYIFFIVPGVILQIRLDFADYFIIDKRMNAFEAMGESWRVTENCALMILLFNVTCYFIEAVGFLCLIIGSVPARWMTGIAKAGVYDKLCQTAPAPTTSVIPPV